MRQWYVDPCLNTNMDGFFDFAFDLHNLDQSCHLTLSPMIILSSSIPSLSSSLCRKTVLALLGVLVTRHYQKKVIILPVPAWDQAALPGGLPAERLMVVPFPHHDHTPA
jgi:hypothetical protein